MRCDARSDAMRFVDITNKDRDAASFCVPLSLPSPVNFVSSCCNHQSTLFGFSRIILNRIPFYRPMSYTQCKLILSKLCFLYGLKSKRQSDNAFKS
jgi:hypothetical protein